MPLWPPRILKSTAQREQGPGFLRGGGRTAGAFLGLLNQPSSDGETANASARNSFRRSVVVTVYVLVPTNLPTQMGVLL